MSQRTKSDVSKWSREAEGNYETFLTRLGQKAHAMVENLTDAAAADAAQGYGKSWKRIAGMLGQMAPVGIESVGRAALKFHIPDGKYRQQVFALEESEGMINVYLPDVSAAAVSRGIISGQDKDGQTYLIGEGPNKIVLELITSDRQEVPAFCKAMLGWGRKALKVTLSPVADAMQLRAVEQLCELAAEGWEGKEQVVQGAVK
ncbi:MAG TPA: hypothetical protein VM008_20465 [Phycisphaerae bacterium]|nr:hypothetical protein [Phycisphaerae bacterium]